MGHDPGIGNGKEGLAVRSFGLDRPIEATDMAAILPAIVVFTLGNQGTSSDGHTDQTQAHELVCSPAFRRL